MLYVYNELKSFLNSEGKYCYFHRTLDIFTLKIKVAMEKTLMYSSQHTAKFEFSRPELKIRLSFGLSKDKNSVPNCKTLAQLTPCAVTQKLRRTVLKKVNTE